MADAEEFGAEMSAGADLSALWRFANAFTERQAVRYGER
jgi:hypothetical protein